MKKTGKLLTIAFVVFMFVFAKLSLSFAIENKYTNQLLKLSIDKSANNKINLNVITTSPYKIKINPIKRSDNEYVIFLPETYHSITAKPDISSINDIQDVDVKLIPYIGAQNNNGYTKIVIKTKSSDVKLNLNSSVMTQEAKVSPEMSKLINKSTSKPKTVVPVPQPKNITVKTAVQNTLSTKSMNRSDVKDNKISDTKKSPAVIKKESFIPVTKPAYQPKQTLNMQEPVVENKTATNVIKEELTNIPPVPSIPNVKKETSNPIKKAANKIQQDNTTLKIVLVSIIALLILFIVVIKYFKSMLMKQMKLAEEKAIANKAKMPIPPKTQKQAINNTVKKPSPQKINTNKPPIDTTDSSIKVIKGFEIEGNKGIYLIQTKYNRVLIGTIDSEVFLLKEFGNIQNPDLIIRKEKSLKTKNIYYVQVNEWRALISASSGEIKLELVLDKTLVIR